MDEAGRGRGRNPGRVRGRAIPAPSSLKEKEVSQHFPFMVARAAREADVVDKFSSRMDKASLKAFAVFGPLRCLQAAFNSFQATQKEVNYRGMFQQIFPCFAHLAGLRARFRDLSVEGEPVSLAGVIPLSDRASSDSAAMYRFDPESSEGQGRADYVLRTITKKKLEAFKARHEEIEWDNPDKEALARTVFETIPDRNVRCDGFFDIKTDSVSQWLVKTRAQLVHYANEAARQNLNKGFDPRPIYLVAIDATRWRVAILDPMGLIKVKGRRVHDFEEFELKQKLRANWLKKKDPQAESYFAKVRPWTLQALQEQLDDVNALLRMESNTSGLVADTYVVSNLWDTYRFHVWNGQGLAGGQLFDGTLSLCEGLLRLVCGDRVCRENWTPQSLRMVFGREHEDDINRCLAFERGLAASSGPRSLDCTYSAEVENTAFDEMKSKPLQHSAAFRKGFTDSIAKVKGCLSVFARMVTTSSDLLKVGCHYGGHEYLAFLDNHAKDKIGTSIKHIVVDSDMCEGGDSVECFKAMAISVDHFPEMPMVMKDCNVLLCYDMTNLCSLWRELYKRTYGCLVVFSNCFDEQALSMLQDLKATVMKLVIVRDNHQLDALSGYLGIQVVDSSASDLINCLGDAKKILTCRDEVLVYHPNQNETNQPLHDVLALGVSGATRRHFHERLNSVLAAVNAINSALYKGVIPGDGIGLLASAVELPQSSEADYRAGVHIVERALKVIQQISPNVSGSSAIALVKANLFKEVSPEEFSTTLERGQFDLVESAEATLDLLARLFDRSLCLASKRHRTELGSIPVKRPRVEEA